MTNPAIRDLLQGLGRHPAFQDLLRLLEVDRDISVSGLTTTAKALCLVLLWQLTERSLLIVVDGNRQAEALSGLISTFYDLLVSGRETPLLLPALDVLPTQPHLTPHTEILEQRAIGLWRLAARRAPITVTPIASALLKTEVADFYRRLAISIRAGEEIPMEDLIAHLEKIGYQKREPVEMVGEYSLRGGILDIFPVEDSKPVRIEFFGDFVESIRRFDVDSQRSVLKIDEVSILPLREVSRGKSSVFALAARPLIVWDEPEQIRGAAERLWKRLEETANESEVSPEEHFFRWDDVASLAFGCSELRLRELGLSLDEHSALAALLDQGPAATALDPPADDAVDLTASPDKGRSAPAPTVEGSAARAASAVHIPSRPSMAFHGAMRVAVAETRTLVERGNRVIFFAPSTGELERLADILQEYSVPFQLALAPDDGTPQYLAQRAYLAGSVASVFLVKGDVARGVVLPDSQVAIFGCEDLFDTSDLVARPAAPKSAAAAFAADIADLKPGDYVVHATHGVGRFLGVREIAAGDQRGDYMLLEYSGEARLYVPLTRMDLVQKYRGAGEAQPPLDKLGGATWSRTKSRVKARMRDMADELLRLYAERKMAEGFAFSDDSNWQREFEDAFEYTETKDQLSAMKEIKRDMEIEQPMDRLLCGDVGFGKTEVAMRAAFKALGDGKQVVVLAPTTVLAFQHYETFRRRFAPFPVRVELLSRFRTAREIKAVLADLADGKVDIVIGTHRLFSKDVEFRDLGLLVVDEEQRFGVAHKERLKQLKKNVDVLTMTATPIPRTLHMSLLGMRDMSVIETPPKDRLAIHTVVAHFHPQLIRTAIEQELSRGGQVFFIHNRVDSIWNRAALIQELVPQARIGVGHGQMGESELEKVLLAFMRHQHDVFVSTTIVENGIDIPLANTIIIDNAEKYGLSELYQLRGRVGRSNRRAYAYLLVPPDTELSEVARKRLAALKEFSDLGAGFKIAALDLEIRGAGNILGGEQHGHIAAVGFDTYVRLLEETVRELKGEEVAPEVHSTLNLGLDIRIPPEYIADEHQRLRAYKRIADVKQREEADRVLAELGDRYGPPPEAVANLLEFSLLKTLAERAGIEAVERRQGMLNIKFHKESRVDPQRLMALVSKTQGAQFTPAGVLRLPLDGTHAPAAVLKRVKEQLQALA